ncbi:MAG TPA: hypothetical protein VGO61_19875 [Steroidobacteraceae bacterium]|nr:hypothetical protein [Steroidobacteraceae bacterium]
MKIFNITRVATAAGIAGALVVAAIAFASGNEPTREVPVTAAVAAAANTLTFENVRVERATPAQMALIAQRRAAARAGTLSQRAYIDANTKQLRQAFPEELAAQAAAARAEAAAIRLDAPRVSQRSDGSRQVVLGSSKMSYAVAHVGPDGALTEDCITDVPSAKAALGVATAARGVDSHEK